LHRANPRFHSNLALNWRHRLWTWPFLCCNY
jgi:hypothetical protein